MAKLLLIVVLVGVALAALRNWVTRSRRLDRDEPADHGPVGAWIVIVAVFVLLVAIFVLPRVVDRLP
jgi:hypothetical protein